MEAATVTPEAQKRRKQRSPSYPAIDLPDAIERAKALYAHEGRNAAPVDAALTNWGYSSKSSGGRLVLAALKKYGLIEDEGSREHRHVQLTRLALTIILDDREDSPERAEAIRTAALAPTIHRELLEKYPHGLPSDSNLRHYLRLERGFTDGAVDYFIPRLRATMAFAGLSNGATLSPHAEDKPPIPGQASPERNEHGPEPPMTPPPPVAAVAPPAESPTATPTPGAPLPVNINLANGGWATLRVSSRVSEQEWQTIMTVLNAMKPGLTAPSDDAAT